MGYRYSNLMSGSRSNTLELSTNVHPLYGVRMSDDVVGDYQRVTLDVDAKDWLYLQVADVEGLGDVAEGTELAISCFARVDGGPCKPALSIRRGDSTHLMHDESTTTWEDVGGGVDPLCHEGEAQFRRVRLAGALRRFLPRRGGDHVRHRAAHGVRRGRAPRMGTGSRGGVAVGE